MITAEYIDYMDAYRIYDTEKPQNTMAYIDDKEEAETICYNENINSMCTDCKRYKNDCQGTCCQVWTGCIYKVKR